MQVTLTEIQDFILGTEDEKVQDPATAVSTEENNSQNAAEDPPSKRVKLDPADPSDGSATAAVVRSNPGESQVCVACLGILQELCGTQQAVKVC